MKFIVFRGCTSMIFVIPWLPLMSLQWQNYHLFIINIKWNVLSTFMLPILILSNYVYISWLHKSKENIFSWKMSQICVYNLYTSQITALHFVFQLLFLDRQQSKNNYLSTMRMSQEQCFGSDKETLSNALQSGCFLIVSKCMDCSYNPRINTYLMVYAVNYLSTISSVADADSRYSTLNMYKELKRQVKSYSCLAS